MATIVPQTTTGGAVAFAAASAGGDTFAFGNTTRPVIMINNASASAITVTLTAVNACSQNFLHNTVVNCPATTITEIVPPASAISAASGSVGNVAVTYSAVTTVTVGAVTS